MKIAVWFCIGIALQAGAAQAEVPASSEAAVTAFIQDGRLRSIVRKVPWGIWPGRLTPPEMQRVRTFIPADPGIRGDATRIGALARDIHHSRYVVRSECLDRNGVARAATSTLNDPGGEICFDAGRIAEQRIVLSELVGLALHEHAHHFGDADENHLWVALANRIYGPLFGEEQERYLDAAPATGRAGVGRLTMVLNERVDHPFFRGDLFGALERGEVENVFFPERQLGFYRWQAMRGGMDSFFEVNVFGSSLAECLAHSLIALQTAAHFYRFLPGIRGRVGVLPREVRLGGALHQSLVLGNEHPLYVGRQVTFSFSAHSGEEIVVSVTNPEFGQESGSPQVEIRE